MAAPRRANFAGNSKKTWDQVQLELATTGTSRVYGLGTFTVRTVCAQSRLNIIKGIYEDIPERKYVDFEQDAKLRTILNPFWFGDERDEEQRSANNYTVPRSLGA